MRTPDITISRINGPGHGQAAVHTAPPMPAFDVSVQLRALDNLRIRQNGRLVATRRYERGALAIADLRQRWDIERLAPYDEMQFRIPFVRLDAFAREVGRPEFAGLTCPPGRPDGVVLGLAKALVPALDAPECASMLFVEHINLAMLTHLTQCYGGLHFSSNNRGTLARWQERRAAEILAARLDGSVSIATLAEACNLSRGHFIKAFKESFGRTPHRWLMDYRTSKAKVLLLRGVPTAEVALVCGFADQSHLSRVFRAATGATPGQFKLAPGTGLRPDEDAANPTLGIAQDDGDT